jgi:hypothetical protein
MSDEGRPASPEADDAVGYGRPPRRTRFRSGRSGNPKGRPKGSRGINKMLRDALSRRVPVQEDGRTRVLTVREVIIRRVVNDAAKMDQKALKILLSLMDRYGGTSETAVDMKELAAEDQAILANYQAEQQELAASSQDDSSAGASHADPGASDADPG